MTRILVADDHDFIRKRIRQILSEEPDFVVECESASGREVIELTQEYKPDVILLDFYLQDMNALQIIPKIRKIDSEVPILILTSLSEETFRRKTLEAGASGFVLKDEATNELVSSIKKIINGKPCQS